MEISVRDGFACDSEADVDKLVIVVNECEAWSGQGQQRRDDNSDRNDG